MNIAETRELNSVIETETSTKQQTLELNDDDDVITLAEVLSLTR